MSDDENMLILNLLDILRTYTDEQHRLTQKDILTILKRDYHKNVVRKTVKQNMDRLIRYGEQGKMNEIAYDIKERLYTNKTTKETEVYETFTNFYYKHGLSHSELRLLIDSVLFSKQIPSQQRKKLIKKIEKLSSKHFDSRVNHISTSPNDGLINNELFETIKYLDRAITNKTQVSFYYNKYSVDDQSKLLLIPQIDPRDGFAREYIINPYHIATANGRYYLICNNDKYDDLSHYRLDRITNIEELETKQKPIEKVTGLENGLDLSKHMAEHIYMFRGESVVVKLRFDKKLLNDFIDWFGTNNINFSDQTKNEITARVHVNQMAMRKWALQYATHVRVLSPDDLVADIRKDIKKALENYL